MKILGIDYGEKRVGISISNEEQDFAFPKTVLDNNHNLIEEVIKIANEEKASLIVLGESKDFKMRDNPVMKKINKFKTKLEQQGLGVVFHPEFMSSQQAENIMGEKNKMIDASAATIILQSYLDSID
jgi:putative Holliday junction resolvase